MLAPAFDWKRSGQRHRRLAGSHRLIRFVGYTLAALVATAPLVTLFRLPVQPPSPFNAGPRIIRAGIWTVHFGLDNKGRDSQRGMTSLIQ